MIESNNRKSHIHSSTLAFNCQKQSHLLDQVIYAALGLPACTDREIFYFQKLGKTDLDQIKLYIGKHIYTSDAYSGWHRSGRFAQVEDIFLLSCRFLVLPDAELASQLGSAQVFTRVLNEHVGTVHSGYVVRILQRSPRSSCKRISFNDTTSPPNTALSLTWAANIRLRLMHSYWILLCERRLVTLRLSK